MSKHYENGVPFETFVELRSGDTVRLPNKERFAGHETVTVLIDYSTETCDKQDAYQNNRVTHRAILVQREDGTKKVFDVHESNQPYLVSF